MKKLLNILLGWCKFLFAKRSQMAKDRLIICFDCKHRKGIFCGLCGCELHAKAEIETEECPRGYWKKPIGGIFNKEIPDFSESKFRTF